MKSLRENSDAIPFYPWTQICTQVTLPFISTNRPSPSAGRNSRCTLLSGPRAAVVLVILFPQYVAARQMMQVEFETLDLVPQDVFYPPSALRSQPHTKLKRGTTSLDQNHPRSHFLLLPGRISQSPWHPLCDSSNVWRPGVGILHRNPRNRPSPRWIPQNATQIFVTMRGDLQIGARRGRTYRHFTPLDEFYPLV
jgi:hypothetical protein